MSKRRYTSAAEIEAAIDKSKAAARAHLARAEALESAASDLAKSEGDFSEIRWRRDEAIQLRCAARNLTEKRLPKLGAKLSEFQTNYMEGVIPDASIPLKL